MAVKQNRLRIIPLGGVDEFGKNMTAIEYGNDIVVIDCGVAFPNEDMLGIDLVIPDVTYLIKNKEKVRGFLITHGHEDHIGALPYVIPHFQVPIYGTKLALALVESKLEEHKLKNVRLNMVAAGDVVNLGCFKAEFLRVCHSVAGALAIAVKTPAGTIVHTGDFKIDHTPIDEEPMDLNRFARLGDEGVLALMSESTNVERPGYTMAEKTVGEAFDRHFKSAEGRIIIATFSSNIHRLQQIVDCAEHYNRKVCFAGRSMEKVANIGEKLGYLNLPEKMRIEATKINRYDDKEIVIVTTGSQGEPMSGLVRMAASEHRNVEISEGDLVIFSSSAIPGNEKLISRVINQLYKRGAKVVYESMAEVHVSGHAFQEELKMMLALTRPRYFIPVHGEYRNLCKHADLAADMGISRDNIFVTDIGNVIEFTRKSARIAGNVPAGSVMIDGSGVGDVGNIVLRDRRVMSQDGIFVVVAGISKQNGTIVSGPDIISRGFIYVRENEDLIDGAREIVKAVIMEHSGGKGCDWAQIKNGIKSKLRNYLYNLTKRNPMILPVIIEV